MGKSRNLSKVCSLALLCLLLFTQNSFGQGTFISSDVSKGFEVQKEQSCIVVMKNQWKAPEFIKSWDKESKGKFVFENLQAVAKKDQKSLTAYFKKESIQYQPYFVFNGVKAVLTEKQLHEIKEIKGIKSILLDQSSQLQVYDRGQSIDREEIEWGVSQIQADKVWELGTEGEGVVVAGQDTGYDFDNPFINGNYRGFDGANYEHSYNWHDAIHSLNPLHNDPDDDPANNPCGLDSNIPCDDHNHGTHTMGTMVGNDPEIKIGVAPKAQWIGCRNMDRGWGSPSTYTECFEWFLAPTDLDDDLPDPSKSPHVIANSWGCPEIEGCNPDNWMFMETVIDNLVAAGIVVVVSAGNDGSQGCSSIDRPASMFESSFVVGASNQVDSVAHFSSYGPVTIDGSGRWKPDVVAPGVDVKSIILDGFGTWSGTSMAGPHVAGAVALMLDANPELKGRVEEIQNILKETAVPVKDPRVCDGIVADQVPNFIAGHGRIDALAAVNTASTWTSTVEQSADSFAIYPNPADNYLYITYSNRFNSIGTMQAYNMLGQLIWEEDYQSGHLRVDLRSWQPGSYVLVHRSTDEIVQVGKFVKL